ncbi:MAG: dynamin family protein [Cyanobacteriota bacterium]
MSQSIGEKHCRMYVKTTNRTARITDIIAKRRPLADKIAATEDNLKSLALALDKLEAHRKRLLTEVEPDIKERLKTIDFSTLQFSITTELEVLDKLRGRFSRDTLNIGVVGRMKQGKSTLLQSLSGLDNDVIPAHSGGACTAVRSTICPRFNAETEAKVTFHSEDSLFKEVILPYYTELRLTPIPASFSDFVNSHLPDKPSSATNEAMYQRLKHDYYSNQAVYRDLLGASQLTVPRHEIQEYVTHANGADTFKSLAVREVKIYCPFPNPEVGQIALVDIPGLGDLRVGDEELMLETLGQEVDVVLFVRRPDPQGDDWQIQDTALYDTAAKALNDLSARSFFVLNQLSDTQNESKKSCERFKQHLNSGQLGIKVVDCIIADCKEPQQANRILDRTLAHLETKILDLDTKYAESCQERLVQLQSAVKAELDKARTALGQAAPDDYRVVEQKFSKLFGNDKKGWWKDVALGLEKLRSELWLHRQAPNSNLQAGVDAAIQACQNHKGILSSENPVEEINERIMVSGSLRAYADYRDELRVLLSHHFLSLDEGLKQSIENVKSQVVDVLIQKGHLGVLTDARGSEFIKELKKLVDEAPSELGRLKQGLEIFAEFELSYRGFMQHRIRKHLDGITNIIPTNSQTGHAPEQQTDTLRPSASTSADEILLALQIEYETAVNRIIPALEELLWEPSQAAYAMVEEFVDNIIHQEDIQEEWKNFLRGVRSQVWLEELGKLEQDNARLQNWLTSVKQVEEANASYSILFLN